MTIKHLQANPRALRAIFYSKHSEQISRLVSLLFNECIVVAQKSEYEKLSLFPYLYEILNQSSTTRSKCIKINLPFFVIQKFIQINCCEETTIKRVAERILITISFLATCRSPTIRARTC